MLQTLRRTPLYERHAARGAKLVPFAGWEMPVEYTSIVDEHRAVREHAGVFDVSHMGQLELDGAEAERYLQERLTNDLERIAPAEAQYTLLPNDRGGVVDDLIAYRRRLRHLSSCRRVPPTIVGGAVAERTIALALKANGR